MPDPTDDGDVVGRPISNWHEEHIDTLTRGQRAADLLRNGMGSWAFIGGFVAFMLVWVLANQPVVTGNPWDPYPFILLNLFLSMLAALQGAILLIAAKRQDAISAALAQNDYLTNVAAKTEIERLMATNDGEMELIRQLVDELRDARSHPAPMSGSGTGSSTR